MRTPRTRGDYDEIDNIVDRLQKLARSSAVDHSVAMEIADTIVPRLRSYRKHNPRPAREQLLIVPQGMEAVVRRLPSRLVR